MKNLLFILGIILLLSSCKKEKLGGFSTPCNGKYQEQSTPYSMSLLDATAQIDTMSTCSGPNFTYPYSIYRLMAINPNNPYEIVYQKKLNPNWEVYIYNFCSNEKNLIYNNSSLQSVSWSTTGEIFLIVGATVQKIENNNASSTLFYLPLS